MKKFLFFLFVFFMAVKLGLWYAMCKCTVWWVATNILEEPATSIILQNFGSCQPYYTALHSKTAVLWINLSNILCSIPSGMLTQNCSIVDQFE